MKTNIDLQTNKVKQFSADGWVLGVCHGVSHWERVERNGLLLATDEVNTTVVRLFAYLHDKWRVDNEEDLEHGKRAAENLPAFRSSPTPALQARSSAHSARLTLRNFP